MSQLGAGGISAFGGGGGQGEIAQWPGIYFGAVSNNADPKKQNRCLLRIPQILGSAVTTWAVSLTPLQNPPAVGTLIAAMFVGGDLDYPCYLVVNPKIVVEGTDANIKPIARVSHAGTSVKLAAADHIHGSIETNAANVQPITSGSAASAGTSLNVAAVDHVHAANVQGLGTLGVNEVTSSAVTSGDTQSTIAMLSRFAAGQSEIDLTADNINLLAHIAVAITGSLAVSGALTSLNLTTAGDVSIQGTDLFIGNGGAANINLNPKMATPSGFPYTTDSNTGSTWATGERGSINQLVNGLNDLVSSLRNRGLMN